MVAILQTTFKMHFVKIKVLYFDLNFIEIFFRARGENKSAFGQVMACWWKDDKPLPEPMMIQFTDMHISLRELINQWDIMFIVNLNAFISRYCLCIY